jgi:hypothetical protein
MDENARDNAPVLDNLIYGLMGYWVWVPHAWVGDHSTGEPATVDQPAATVEQPPDVRLTSGERRWRMLLRRRSTG